MFQKEALGVADTPDWFSYISSMRTLCCVVTAVASLIALLPLPSHAQTTHGIGNLSCGQFIRAARSGDILYHQASSWLLGYASGMNAALKSTATATLTNDQLLKQAGDYCEANPASTIAQAADAWPATLTRPAVTQEAAPMERNYDHLKKPFARGPR